MKIFFGKFEFLGALGTAFSVKLAAITASDVAHYGAAFAAVCTGFAMLARAAWYYRNGKPPRE